MRKILLGFSALFLIGWLGWPYLTLYQLNQAVMAEDEIALDRLVNWDSVSYHLHQDLEALFDTARSEDAPGDASQGGMEGFLDALLTGFANILIDPIVSFYTTPQGLSYLLNTQVILEDPAEIFQDDFPSGEGWYENITFAFFSGPTSFFANVRPTTRMTKEGVETAEYGTMTLVLRFEDFGWKLSRIDLPLEE